MNTQKPKPDLTGKTIALTGAGGFIGSHLAEALIGQGARLKALLRYNSRSDTGWLKAHEQIEVTFGDIRDQSLIERFVKDCDIVFHLAALIGIPYSYYAPQSYVDTNIGGTLNLLEACRKSTPQKIILTSTSEVYGTALSTPMCEKHPLQAQSPYAASKVGADMLGLSYAKSFELPVTLVRPFNTFGPRQSMRAVIPTIIVQALTSSQINLGKLTPVRDFNYVADTVAGFIAAAQPVENRGQVFNLATGKGYSIKEVAELIVELTRSKATIKSTAERLRPESSEVEMLIGNADKAEQLLNWKAKTDLAAGLGKTIDWIKSNLEHFPGAQSFIK